MHSNLPTFIYLTQDDEEHVFVADCTNNTVFEMSSEVKFQLLAGEQQGIKGLGRICVGDNQRMIVAHAEKIGCFVPYVSIYKLIWIDPKYGEWYCFAFAHTVFHQGAWIVSQSACCLSVEDYEL